MDKKDRIDAFGATLLVCFSVLLGFNQVLIKLINAGLSPAFQAGLRSVCAVGPVLLFALLTRKKLSISDGSLAPGIFCGTFFAVEFLLSVLGARLHDRRPGLGVLLHHAVLGRARGAFPDPRGAVDARAHYRPGACLHAGVAWALLDSDQAAGDYAFYGDVACIFAAILWAGIALLASTTALKKSTPVMQLLYQLTVSSVILLPASLLFGDLVRDFTPAIGAMFAFQVLGVVCVGFLTWFWVLSIYPASDMVSFSFLTPVFGVLFGWLLLGEEVTYVLIGALVLVSVGIVLITRKPTGRVRESISGRYAPQRPMVWIGAKQP